jgi:CHAT domain-containing protein
MMVVIQPDTPGCSTLPYAREELLEVEQIVQSHHLITLGVKELPASVENVLSHLSNVSIAHFACHGQQDMVNPLESGLILDGGKKLEVSKIMDQSELNASLVFLSACDTALGDEDHPDEAMHFAASMLFAGFRAAVATMW